MKEQIQLSDHFTYGRLIRFTMPTIGMMIFMSIYGVVDGFFVSNFAGKTPFAAVNLIFPVLMIMSTVGFMFGTGGSAIVAKTFGMRDHESANRYFSLFVYIAFGLGVILAVISFVFLRPIAVLLGAEGQLLEDAVRYGRIILMALTFHNPAAGRSGSAPGGRCPRTGRHIQSRRKIPARPRSSGRRYIGPPGSRRTGRSLWGFRTRTQ